jgi:hypothetical protein
MIGWSFKSVPDHIVVRCRSCGGPAKMVGHGGRFYFMDGAVGIVSCPECISSYSHTLDWPSDAFYRVEHRRKVLWAWNREYLVMVREYIASSSRKTEGSYYLRRKLPKFFLLAKHRQHVVDKIDAVLTDI